MRKACEKYGVCRKEVEPFSKFRVVSEWLGKFGAGTVEVNGPTLCRYFKWLRVVKGVVFTPKELLNDQVQCRASLDIGVRRKHLSWVLQFTRNNPDFEGYSDGRKYSMYVVIKSFYDFHEVPLTTANNVFGPRRKRKYRRKQITLSDAKKIMGVLGQRERTILLIDKMMQLTCARINLILVLLERPLFHPKSFH